MRVDTHVHLLARKDSSPDWSEIDFALKVARSNGLDALCVTEHRDAVHYLDLLDEIFGANRLGGELREPGILRLPNGLLLSAGAEVSLAGGGDVGVHASPEILRQLDDRKGAYTLPSLHTALANSDRDRAIVCHHLFFRGKWIAGIEDCLECIDAIELPAKDLSDAEQYREFAERHDLATVGGGDAHTWLQIGACYTELPDESGCTPHAFDVGRLRRALGRKQAKAVPVPGGERLVRMSRMYRDHTAAASH